MILTNIIECLAPIVDKMIFFFGRIILIVSMLAILLFPIRFVIKLIAWLLAKWADKVTKIPIDGGYYDFFYIPGDDNFTDFEMISFAKKCYILRKNGVNTREIKTESQFYEIYSEYKKNRKKNLDLDL